MKEITAPNWIQLRRVLASRFFLLYICILIYLFILGHAVAQLVKALRYKLDGREFDSLVRAHYGPRVDSASNGCEYQKCLVGSKVGAYGWQTYPLNLPIVFKSWNLILLDLSRHVQATTGIIVHFRYRFYTRVYIFHASTALMRLGFTVVEVLWSHSATPR
jgi:hypothetical protein